MRCPVLVGRRTEMAALRAAAAAARIGRGSTAALVGAPGMGKSRLVRETVATARAWQLPVLVGRSVESCSGSAFRPLTEALLGGLRRTPDPVDPALDPFRPVLGRLLPQWRTPRTGDDPLEVLGEAVLRLLSALAGDGGLLLVLEDLHWADPETLTVLEYLADNVGEERVFVLVTAREQPGPVLGLLRTLGARHSATLLPLGPLDPPEVDAMAAACTGADVPAHVRSALHRRAGGTPLLVEELLAAKADPDAVVPATVAELVAARLDTLAPAARRCVQAAAVLGPSVEWGLLAATLDAPAPDVLAALRAASHVGLLEHGDDVRFHHALGRDAVLAAMPPPERTEWARRGLLAVVAAHPDLDGPWCDLAAELAVRAGDTVRATAVLVEAARRNLDRGALVSAEAVLRHARTLAGEDVALAADADDLLADVLALAGKTTEAVAAGLRCVDRLRHDRGPAAATAHLRLARVHATAGDWPAADAALRAARDVGDGEPALQIEATAARVALGAGHFTDAVARARAVLEHGQRAGAAEEVCDALLVLGRIARRDDLGAAEKLAERARQVAEEAGLAVPAARALYEVVISDVQFSLRLDRLAEARERATSLGDIAAVAVLDLQRSATHYTRWEPDAAVAAARSCVAASRRFHLPTLPKALVLGAAAHTYLDHTDAAEHDMVEALALAPEDTHLLGEVWGVRAYRALVAADDTRALEHLERASKAFALRPNEVTGSPAVGLWTVLRAVADPAGTPPDPTDPHTARWNVGLAGFADAVAHGRRGAADAAQAAFAQADALLRAPVDIAWHRLQARRIVAGAALADGWGEPARWLSEDLPQWEARGQDRCVRAVRGLWRRTGAVVPRRGRGMAVVPERLRALAVTGRETDVLALVADGGTNREIAERLFLSPRTVEKHVERLLAKSGLTRRTELAAWGSRILRAP